MWAARAFGWRIITKPAELLRSLQSHLEKRHTIICVRTDTYIHKYLFLGTLLSFLAKFLTTTSFKQYILLCLKDIQSQPDLLPVSPHSFFLVQIFWLANHPLSGFSLQLHKELIKKIPMKKVGWTEPKFSLPRLQLKK